MKVKCVGQICVFAGMMIASSALAQQTWAPPAEIAPKVAPAAPAHAGRAKADRCSGDAEGARTAAPRRTPRACMARRAGRFALNARRAEAQGVPIPDRKKGTPAVSLGVRRPILVTSPRVQ